jgi:hypothetical protein
MIMVNKTSANIVKENIITLLLLILELVVIICLTITLLIIRRPETPVNDDFVGTMTAESKMCNSKKYKAFDDRVFYYSDSNEVDVSLLSVVSDNLVTNYSDPDIKVLITDTPVLSDDVTVVRGYQVVNSVILENTFFAIDVKGSELLGEFPPLINPGQIKLDGLMEESEAEDTAYSVIKTEANQDNIEVEGACSYELFFTNSDNGVISKPSSNYYYEFTFNLSKESSFPKGFVFMDGKTGEILESFIDSGIRT